MRSFRVTVNGQVYDVSVEELNSKPRVTVPTEDNSLDNPSKPVMVSPKPKVSVLGGNRVLAPMPGVILQILVNPGQIVKSGDVLLVLEAMKMENEVTAAQEGTIKEVAVSKGSSVNTGDLMVIIE